ncbi:aquaporin-like protein [Atractiella rhizophila]|nr:aquaporin-like protein [Atractiella rhizophila]
MGTRFARSPSSTMRAHIPLNINIISPSDSSLAVRSSGLDPISYHTAKMDLEESKTRPSPDFPGSLAFTPAPENAYTHSPFSILFSSRGWSLREWTSARLWKQGLIEAFGTLAVVFLSGAANETIQSYGTSQPGPYIAISNFVVVSLAIFATGPVSGGHVNSLITISTVLTGLCRPVRGVIYVFCQLIGAAVAGALLRGGMGIERTRRRHAGGCWFPEDGSYTAGQALVVEFSTALSVLFIAYGVGLDPRSKELNGPALGPFLVGLTIALSSWSTSGLVPGFSGGIAFPTRCFGMAFGSWMWQREQWVWWIGDLLAAAVSGVLYRVVPPYKHELKEGEQNGRCEELEKASKDFERYP